MRRIVPAGLLVLTLVCAGCQGVVGPRQRRCLPGRVDDPCLTIDEQERRKRDRLALPEESPTVGPRTNSEEPSRRGVIR